MSTSLAPIPIQISYRNLTKSFYLSPTTSPQLLQMLIKRAFRLRFKIDGLITPQKQIILFSKLPRHLQKSHHKSFTIHAQDEDSQSPLEGISYSRSKSNLSKESGRKMPPDQNQLPEEKYFIEDFQLFMAEMTAKHNIQTLGILFFSSLRYAKQLGRKMLTEMVYEYGNVIEFYYSLYPMKSIIKEDTVGPMMMFTLFSGKEMVLERKFQQTIGAKQEILKFIKLLIDSGDLQRKIKHIRARKELSDSHVISLSKQVSAISMAPQQQQHRNKSQSRFNQVSFDNNDQNIPIQQPHEQWFFEQNGVFDDLEQGMLRYLINTKQKHFEDICNGLELNNIVKKEFNTQVIKLVCRDWINKSLDQIKSGDKKVVFEAMKDKQSKISIATRRFREDGNLAEMLQSIEVEFQQKVGKSVIKASRFSLDPLQGGSQVPSAIQSRSSSPRVSYLDIASGLNHGMQTSGFKLRLCQDIGNIEQTEQKQSVIPAKQPTIHKKIMKLADYYHHGRLGTGYDSLSIEDIEMYQQNLRSYKFTEEEIRRLLDLYTSGDPFVRKQIPQVLSTEDVKYLKELLDNKTNEYEILQELQSPSLSRTRRKIQKFSNFRSLISYLFNYKFINKKQSKLFVYLYTWEDINVLGAFQSYLVTQNLLQLQDTLYLIDQIYFLTKKYGVDISEVEKFSNIIEHQISLLFTHKNLIPLQNRLALQKLIRAGDTTIIKLYRDYKGQKKDTFLKKINEYAQTKRIQLQQLQESQKTQQRRQMFSKFQKIQQIQQVLAIRLKDHMVQSHKLVLQCIEIDEPIILGIWQVKELTNDMAEFVDNLRVYVQKVTQTHMKRVIVKKLGEMENTEGENAAMQKLLQESSPLLKGIYQVYKETNDVQEMKDTLKRACQKLNKSI